MVHASREHLRSIFSRIFIVLTYLVVHKMLSARRFAIKKKNLIGYRYVPKELVFKNHWGYLVFSVDNHNLTFYKILYASML